MFRASWSMLYYLDCFWNITNGSWIQPNQTCHFVADGFCVLKPRDQEKQQEEGECKLTFVCFHIGRTLQLWWGLTPPGLGRSFLPPLGSDFCPKLPRVFKTLQTS